MSNWHLTIFIVFGILFLMELAQIADGIQRLAGFNERYEAKYMASGVGVDQGQQPNIPPQQTA